MKIAVVLFSVLALSLSAPQPRKPFHEHFEEFLDLISDEAGDEVSRLVRTYLTFDEFRTSINYLSTANFKNLVYEMESLPEFQAVTEFLEKDNIDVLYFIDLFNESLETGIPMYRQEVRGRDFSSFLYDCIDVFPTPKLQALYDSKMANEEEFSTAINNLQSEEWDSLWGALWDSPIFQKEVQTLGENGIDMELLLNELMAIFGQKK